MSSCLEQIQNNQSAVPCYHHGKGAPDDCDGSNTILRRYDLELMVLRFCGA